MRESYKVWEIIRGFDLGSYIEGDVFINELGQEIHFDGESIKGLDNIDPSSKWTYVPYKSRWEAV